MTADPRPEAVTTYPPAGIDRRFYAFALDRCLAWPAIALLGYLAWTVSWREGGLWGGIALLVLGALGVSAGFAGVLGLRGATPGKAVLGLRVVDAASGGTIGFPRALLRTLVLALAGLPTFGLGVATLAQTAVLDPSRQRRGWHDRRTDSVVVDVRPVPVPVEEVEQAPRQLVNLTAMRLVPATPATSRLAAAPTAAPPRRTPDGAEAPSSPATSPAAPATTPQPAPPAVSPAPSATTPQPAAPAVPPTPVPPPPEVERTVVRGSRPAPTAPRWSLTLDSGETLVVEGLTLLGRRPEGRPGEAVHQLVPLASQDMSVSKTHAHLQVARDGSLSVTDRGSTNGSLLVRAGVSRQLAPGQPATLLAGDAVRLGDRTLTVHRD